MSKIANDGIQYQSQRLERRNGLAPQWCETVETKGFGNDRRPSERLDCVAKLS